MILNIAIQLILHTGCRPIEAAYIILKKTARFNDEKMESDKFMEASVPGHISKTVKPYFWALDVGAGDVVMDIMYSE